MMKRSPPAKLLRSITSLQKKSARSLLDERRLCDAQRNLLRSYCNTLKGGEAPNKRWREAALNALSYLGSDADRQNISIGDYDEQRFGPFPGVSDDGYSGEQICQA